MKQRKLYGPKKKAKTLMKPGDYHLCVYDYEDPSKESCLKAFDYHGKMLFKIPALAKGVNGPSTHVRGGDTPPGLYRLGEFWVSKPWESRSKIWHPYGKYCYDLVELENQERSRKRSECCLHCGGSGAEPHPLAPMQSLTYTLGCVRVHNRHMAEKIVPLTHERKWGRYIRRSNNVFLSVYQDQD